MNPVSPHPISFYLSTKVFSGVESLLTTFPGDILIFKPTVKAKKLGRFIAKKNTNRIGYSYTILISANLQEDLFLFTFLHEYAHYLCFKTYNSSSYLPHGKEWKLIFTQLLHTYKSYFSEEVYPLVDAFIQKPRAATAGGNCPFSAHFLDTKSKKEESVFLQFCSGDIFIFKNKKYRFLQRRRTRFLAECISSGKKYTFSSQADIQKCAPESHKLYGTIS